MFNLCIALLAAGMLCLVAEIFISGFGILGVSGIALMVVSAVLAVLYVPFGWVFVLAEAAVLAVLLFMLVKFIKRRQLQGKLFMKDTLEEDVPQIGDPASFVGKVGCAKTALLPFGDADFNGLSVEVMSDGPYIEKGTKVKVAEIRQSRIVVNALE
jgi:membrane-bound ClpP family serine protease